MYDLISILQKIKTPFPKTTLIKNCYHMKMNANVTQTIIYRLIQWYIPVQCEKVWTYLLFLVFYRMSQNPGNDISRLFAKKDTARHRALDELSVSHKKISDAVPNIVRERGSLIASGWFDSVSSTLEHGPSV